jgi:hypothetical protein
MANASHVPFGWDFQVNAAIVFFVENIKDVRRVRIEGASEDIELELNSGKYVFAQAKSVVRESDVHNVRGKLYSALETLDVASKPGNVEKFVYVTNSPNPFAIEKTMGSFVDRTIRKFDELPQECQEIIEKRMKSKSYENLDLAKFEVHVIPFFTDNEIERYKIVMRTIERLTYKINESGMSAQLHRTWKEMFSFNSSQSDTSLTLTKNQLIWPIIVIKSEVTENSQIFDEYDSAEVDEILRKYREFIDDRVEHIEFSMTVVNRFSQYSSETSGSRKEKIEKFIETHYKCYLTELGLSEADPFGEILVKLILDRVLKNRLLIERIREEVNL